MSKRYINFRAINNARKAKASKAAQPAKAPARKSNIEGRPPLSFINLTASEDVQMKTNTNKTGNNDGHSPYAIVHGVMKNGKKVTVQTYVKKGIEALTGLKAGQTIQLSGTWENGKVGDTRIRTFAAMGTYSTKAQKAAVVAQTPAPAAAPAPEVASETPVAAAA